MLVIVTGIGYLPFISIPISSSRQLQPPESKTVAEIKIVPKAEPVPTIAPQPVIEASAPKTYPAIGNATSESVTTAIEFYQSKNITNVGVAYLVGNFVAESGLRPDAVGDHGLALGIAQWHPSRRVGLPDDLQGQLQYAWNEIQHYPLASALYSTNEWILQNGIKGYEGYSVEGNRFMYARELLKELQ